jgi:tetratricopeptide (TPR) repeat protein
MSFFRTPPSLRMQVDSDLASGFEKKETPRTLSCQTVQSSGPMLKINLRSSSAAAAFLFIVLGVGGLLSVQTARFAIASEFAETGDPRLASWALRLDPKNARLHNRVGLQELWETSGTARALPHLYRATELSPHNAAYWVALGNGCELAEDPQCATRAYEKALALAPRRGEFLWDLGNYYLRIGDQANALDRFARYLQMVPAARERTVSLLLRGIHDPMLIWDKTVHRSGDPGIELVYLNALKQQDPQAQTAALWREVLTEGKTIPAPAAILYINRLLELHDYREAKQAWLDLQANRAVPKLQPANELVFNGDFSEKPLNGGLDWRLQERTFLHVDMAQAESCRERHCLYVNFTVPQNLEYEPAYQMIPVQPHQLYSLSAFVRSVEITSDSGPRLKVKDPDCPTCLNVMTPAAVETRSWHKVDVTFITGTQTQVIQVSVFRPQSRTFPMEISGEFWLDSVSLKPIGGEALR